MKRLKLWFLNSPGLFIIFFLSLIPLYSLFHPGLPVTHDGIDHVARIANFYTNLKEGVFIPRWAGNLNWGYGHPILMFLYPLPSYMASIFHLLGFSLINSVKLVFFLSFIASGVTMYIWLKKYLSEPSAILGGVLYVFAPYRFIDLYVRGAIGEHVAFIFPPLILYFLLMLSRLKKINLKNSIPYILGISISLSFLILSHNAISLMFLPFIFIYFLILFFQTKQKEFLIIGLASLIFGFLLSFFFWFPAFFEGKYTLRDIVTKGTYVYSFVKPLSFLYGSWSFGGSGQFSTQLGIIQIFFLLATPFAFKKIKKEKSKLLPIFLLTFIFFFFSIFLMLKESDFIYQTITTLGKIQFPWRFLTLSVFTTSIISAFVFSTIPNKFQKPILALLIIITILLSSNYSKAKGFLYKTDGFFYSVYKSTTDTGESAPIWSVRFMEKEPKKRIETIEGKTIIKELTRETTYHSYEIDVLGEKARIRENTLYFPGWNVFVDRNKTSVEFQDPNNRGLMTFYVPKGRHQVEIIFSETKLRDLSNKISFFSILGLIFFSIAVFIKRKNA